MQSIIEEFDGYWLWFSKGKNPSKDITGKYLFFSKDKNALREIAVREIKNNGFKLAKINQKLMGTNTEYVLCLYHKNDSRKYELADKYRGKEEIIKYRYWKSDEDTIKGKYSEEFLQRLTKSQRKKFEKGNPNN